MRECRTASVVAVGALSVGVGLEACREAPAAGPASPPAPAAGSVEGARQEPPFVIIRDLPQRVRVRSCEDTAIAVVDGKAHAFGEDLGAGDVLFVRHGDDFEATGSGVVVFADYPRPPALCAGPAVKEVVRATSTPELTWGRGKMHAQLQLGEKQGSAFYLGRLDGSLPVAPHVHKGSWEILAAIDAAGTFVLDGKQVRMAPRTVALVPPDTPHEWRPDPGSNLRAVQIYFPPGPEQRFLGLAAAEADAGAK